MTLGADGAVRAVWCDVQAVAPLPAGQCVRPPNPWRWHAGVIATYAVTAGIFLDHGVSLGDHIAAAGPDPYIFIWFLKWWPFSIRHGIDPFQADLVWQPVGMVAVWITSIPLLGVLLLPVTLTGGPVLAYNLVVIAAPVLSATAAYALCLRVSRDRAAAAMGGFLFGFSSYAMKLVYATPNLSMTCFIPLLFLVAVMRFQGAISRLPCLVCVWLLLVCVFLTSLETFAGLFIFCALSWAVAMGMVAPRRAGLTRLVIDGFWLAPFLCLTLSPFLLMLYLHRHYLSVPSYWPYRYSADAFSLIGLVPPGLVASVWRALTGCDLAATLPDQVPSLSLPLSIILVLFAATRGRWPAARLLVVMLLVMLVLSLGPALRIGGAETPVLLPWSFAVHLPLLKDMLTNRFSLYVTLLAAVMAAVWIAAGGAEYRRWRLALGGLACLVLVPNVRTLPPAPMSAFFAPGRLQAVLGPQPRVLILPFAINGASTFWQMENDFGFRQTGGYLGPPPAAFIGDPAVVQLYDATPSATFKADFQRFCETTQTQYVIAGPGTEDWAWAALRSTGWPTRKIDDVTVFTVEQTSLAGAGRE